MSDTGSSQAISKPNCVVCQDELREAADLLLLNGHEFRSIARKLERPREFADALKSHLYAKHVQGVTRENYVILVADYLMDARRLLTRELEKPDKEQRVSIINMAHRAIQWSIKGYCQMEGLWAAQSGKKVSTDVIDALNALAQGDPDAVKRIAAARKKEIPVLTQAKPVANEAE